MTLLLRNEDYKPLLKIHEYVDILDWAYRALSDGRAVERRPSRNHTYLPIADGNTYLFKSIEGGLENPGVYAIRMSSDILNIHTIEGKRRIKKLPRHPGQTYFGIVLLFSSSTGELLAVLHDGWVNRMCTGATGGLGAKYMAREDARTLGLIGSGWQAGAQVMAVCAVRPIERVRVYSPTAGHSETFAREMTKELGIAVEPVPSPLAAIRSADIVVVATNTMDPVFAGKWLESGMHLTSIVGATIDVRGERIKKHEIDLETIRRADVFAVTSKSQALHDEEGDIFDPVFKDKILAWEDVVELPELVAGKVRGRKSAKQITVFKHQTGNGLWYASAGHELYKRALERGVGEEFPARLLLQDLVP
jgi:ornithine cyclodeaminase/alanine dehydrogenase-like protein (mu-crystallin family)